MTDKKIQTDESFKELLKRISKEDLKVWENTLRQGTIAQQLIPNSVAVGGTAVALYTGHRISLDVDNLLFDLRKTFQEILDTLENTENWKTVRLAAPNLILGRLNSAEIGFRQIKYQTQIETVTMETPYGIITVPAFHELLCMKTVLIYLRNTTRDFLDFYALAMLLTENEVVNLLLDIENRFTGITSNNLVLEISKTLASAQPIDLSKTNLSSYKALDKKYSNWDTIRVFCERIAALLTQKLLEKE